MLTPGLGIVLLISSSLVIVTPFILMIGSLTLNTVNIRIMTTMAWSNKRAEIMPQHLMHLLRLSFCMCRAASSWSLLGWSVAGASGLTCSFSTMAKRLEREGRRELVLLSSRVVVMGSFGRACCASIIYNIRFVIWTGFSNIDIFGASCPNFQAVECWLVSHFSLVWFFLINKNYKN